MMNRLLVMVGLRRDPTVDHTAPTFASPAILAVFVVVMVAIVVGLNHLF